MVLVSKLSWYLKCSHKRKHSIRLIKTLINVVVYFTVTLYISNKVQKYYYTLPCILTPRQCDQMLFMISNRKKRIFTLERRRVREEIFFDLQCSHNRP